MLRVLQGTPHSQTCDGLSRRELLRFGGLAALAGAAPRGSFAAPAGSAQRLLFISLFGGPSHQDIWDMKPDAPAEVRGEFKPIPTNVPGIEITEHLPRLSRLAHLYSLVRSMTHPDNGHGSAMYTAFTGFPHRFPNTNPIPSIDDSPSYASVVSRLRPLKTGTPQFIVVGGTQFVCGNQIPGQRAGWLGPAYEPYVINGDPNREGFRVPELTPAPEIGALRLDRRRGLMNVLDGATRLSERSDVAESLGVAQRAAFELLASERIRAALDLGREPVAVRDRFTRSTFGQSLLLGRRLLEAGVPSVTVNWSTGGPWDTHGSNFTSLKQKLLPAFDATFSALLTDLHERGLLDSTLIICTGEFGRTPNINKDAGRDHWAGVYTTVLAGGGIQGGRVHGTSDARAAYPASDAVGPADVSATAFHCLGISPESEILDRTARPQRISRGEPIRSLL